ncbi:MAG: HAMP domain-containing protein [Pseudomonadota bacterium]|nr:HAMP domain-containing protein [Pseudomonadota bacterium]
MTLRLKINLIVGVLTLLFVAAVLGLQVRSLRASVEEEVVAANRVALQLLNRTAWLYAAQGMPAMQAFLQGMGRVRANDIELLDEAGRQKYSSPPSTYKSGREAPDWFASLVSPPPSMQSIDFPGGKLVIRGNATRAVVDAWDDFLKLALIGLALLAAANVLVFWLVGRTVRPFSQIVGALDQLQGGRFDVSLPPLPGTEAAAIGAAFNRMVGVLQENIDTERRAARAERQLSDNRELTRWVDHHIEKERLMIARELHDELGQSVTAMRSMALSIAQRTRGRDAQSEQAAQLIADESARLYDAMHGMIPRLTPMVLDNFGLAEALGDLVERTRRSHPDIQIDLQVDLADTPLDTEQALALYRAAQEGITNGLRHGQATLLGLTVRREADAVLLRLIDNGIGLAPDWAQRVGHHGLRWLSERVEALGGAFEVGAAPSQGVLLQVRLPLPAPMTAAAAVPA